MYSDSRVSSMIRLWFHFFLPHRLYAMRPLLAQSVPPSILQAFLHTNLNQPIKLKRNLHITSLNICVTVTMCAQPRMVQQLERDVTLWRLYPPSRNWSLCVTRASPMFSKSALSLNAEIRTSHLRSIHLLQAISIPIQLTIELFSRLYRYIPVVIP